MNAPIADPNETPDVESEVREFPNRFWPYFAATWLQTAVPTIFVLGFVLRPVFMLRTEAFLITMVYAATILTALIILLCLSWCRLAPIKISPRGICVLNDGFVWREFEWSQIVNVELKRFLLPCANVSLANGKRFLIPLYLEDERGFAEFVFAHTPPQHPLHQFLRARVK